MLSETFKPEGEDYRGAWGYMVPSGAPAVQCGTCGMVILEQYGPEKPDGDQDIVTHHECWSNNGK